MRSRILLLLSIFTIISCSGHFGVVNVTFVPLSDAKYQPRAETHPIKISMDGNVERKYVKLGRISAEGCPACAPEYILEKIKTRTRRVGGDAVINIDSFTAPAGTVGGGATTIRGLVIRWAD